MAEERDAVFASHSPVDGSELEPVTATPVAELPALLDAAREAQRAWAQLPVHERAELVGRAKQQLLSRAEEIAELVRLEVGKPIEEAALAEVLPNADLIDYWCDAIEELLDSTPIELDPLSYPGKSGRTVKDPRGVIALITPWNYPVAIPLRTIVPALLCGNAVVFKPSEVTPRCGALVVSLFAELLPEGVLTLVQGDGELGAALASERVDLVVFTGSVASGRAVAKACAERLVPCSLELGGKDAAIVLADCNLERAANGVVWGAFTNAGQNCASVERVYVEKDIADKFIKRVVEITEELRPGIDTAMMTTQAQKAIAQRHLEQAIEAGAELLSGGDNAKDGETKESGEDDGDANDSAKDDSGEDSHAFTPAVLRVTDDSDEAAFMTEETFGPLLPIRVVDSAEQAVELANASRYALTTSIWTKKTSTGQKLAEQLHSGVVTINNHGFTAALPAAPWTGTGDTGYGITNSPHTLSTLTRVRFVLADENSAKRELWWYPYTPVLRTIAFAMARLRGGAGLLGRLSALVSLIGALPKRLLGG